MLCRAVFCTSHVEVLALLHFREHTSSTSSTLFSRVSSDVSKYKDGSSGGGGGGKSAPSFEPDFVITVTYLGLKDPINGKVCLFCSSALCFSKKKNGLTNLSLFTIYMGCFARHQDIYVIQYVIQYILVAFHAILII